MKKLLFKILFRLLDIPIANEMIDQPRMKEWLGNQYPLPEFRNYISSRNLHLLQVFGEGIAQKEEYWITVGRRIELGLLLTDAKKNFAITEKKRKERENENLKNKKN